MAGCSVGSSRSTFPWETAFSAKDTSALALSATGATLPVPAAVRKPLIAATEALGLAGVIKAAPRILELLKNSDAEVW